jgi:hypothetical protein
MAVNCFHDPSAVQVRALLPLSRRGEAALLDTIAEGKIMKGLTKIIGAAALAATTAASVAVPADAATRRHHYYGSTRYSHKVCRRSSATTGKVVGGVAGALVGHSLIGHGLLGTAAGAVGGVVAGGAVDRASTAPRRCYYTR